ncbi:MAG: tellurite resistance/C4-dicarboxylate transporter family protein [Acidimicrobiales bacterium]|nr:tellurite resistance/C4-dicarboxylate transporter family protein [Acidimicrobiales bacterium]
MTAPGPSAPPTPGRISSNVRTLFPGYFAMVMATGIIAVAAAQQDLTWMAEGLYVIAAAAYVVLAVLLAARLVIAPSLIAADITSHAKGFAFLTTVAGTNVLGSASGIVHGWWTLAWWLWWVSLALWAVCLYSTLFAVVLKGPKPDLGHGINGTWFLLTVATESVVVLGALLLPRHPSDLLAFVLLAAFLLGLVLYLIVMTMVFFRWTFLELDPTEADPPAWIAAGAVAITVLAGSNLLTVQPTSDRIERLAPFIEGIVVLAWATATFWFPLMVAIGIWRHVLNRVPLRYHPSYWALVFPLGMYSAATFRMLGAIDLDGLSWMPRAALAVALAAWSAAFVGLIWQGVDVVRRPFGAPPS